MRNMNEVVLRDVEREMKKAIKEFPKWPTDPIHAVAVVAEESGELQKAVLEAVYEPEKFSIHDVRWEAIQTIAMCLRFIHSLDAKLYAWEQSNHHVQNAEHEPRRGAP